MLHITPPTESELKQIIFDCWDRKKTKKETYKAVKDYLATNYDLKPHDFLLTTEKAKVLILADKKIESVQK